MADKVNLREPKQDPKWRAWRNWAVIFIPCFGVSMIAIERFGLYRSLPILVLLSATVLMYQRYVKKRTWRSILWGGGGPAPVKSARERLRSAVITELAPDAARSAHNAVFRMPRTVCDIFAVPSQVFDISTPSFAAL